MNYQAWTLVAVWLGVLISVGLNLRSSGMREQRLVDLEKGRDEHKTWLETHDSRLNEVDLELAENRGFRKGFEAGKVHAGKPHQ